MNCHCERNELERGNLHPVIASGAWQSLLEITSSSLLVMTLWVKCSLNQPVNTSRQFSILIRNHISCRMC